MGAPVATFIAAARGIRVRVRVLPTIADVDALREAPALPSWAGGCRAFFAPRHAAPHAAGTIGTIVLPGDGALLELVPHEVTHAVMHDLRAACHSNDEELATTVGLLSAAIFKALERRGLAPW